MQVGDNTIELNNMDKTFEELKGSTNTPPILLVYKRTKYFLFKPHKFSYNKSTSNANTEATTPQPQYEVILPDRDSLFTSDKLSTLMEELANSFNIKNDVSLYFESPIKLLFGINLTYSQELTLSDIAALYFGLRTNSDPFVVELQEDSSNFFRDYNTLVEKSQERGNNLNSSFSVKLENMQEEEDEESSTTTNPTNLNQSSNNIIERDESNNFSIINQEGQDANSLNANNSSEFGQQQQIQNIQQLNDIVATDDENAGEEQTELQQQQEEEEAVATEKEEIEEGFVSIEVDNNEQPHQAEDEINQLPEEGDLVAASEVDGIEGEQDIATAAATEYIEEDNADEMQVDPQPDEVSQSQQAISSGSISFAASQDKSTTARSSYSNESNTTETQTTVLAGTEEGASEVFTSEDAVTDDDENAKINPKKRERENSSNGYSTQEDIDTNGNYIDSNDNNYYEPAFKRQKVEATI